MNVKSSGYVLLISASIFSVAASAVPFVANDIVVGKVFDLQGHCGPTETWTYARTPVGPDTRIDRTQTRTDDFGATCRFNINSFLNSASEYTWLQKDKYDDTGSVLEASYVWDRPVVQIITTMGDNNLIADAASSIADPGHNVETLTFLGIEDVTVPAGSYTGCLKLHKLRVSDASGNVSQITWRCPEVGIVKMVQGHTDFPKLQVWELSNVIIAPPLPLP